MAGVLLHLAMGDPEKTDPENATYSASFKKAYTLGLLLPDIAKRGFIRKEEEFDRFFKGCSRDDILTYEEYLSFRKNNHFSPNGPKPSQQDTRNPDLEGFMDAGYVDLQKAVRLFTTSIIALILSGCGKTIRARPVRLKFGMKISGRAAGPGRSIMRIIICSIGVLKNSMGFWTEQVGFCRLRS